MSIVQCGQATSSCRMGVKKYEQMERQMSPGFS